MFDPPGLVAVGCITEVALGSPAARGRFELRIRVRRYAAGCMCVGARASRRGASKLGCGTYGGCDWPGNAAMAPTGWVTDLAHSGKVMFLEGREVRLASLADLGAAAPPRCMAESLTLTSGQTCAEWALMHEGARVKTDLGDARAAAVGARAARRRGAATEADRWATAAREAADSARFAKRHTQRAGAALAALAGDDTNRLDPNRLDRVLEHCAEAEACAAAALDNARRVALDDAG